MKTISIILTILLIISIVGFLSSAGVQLEPGFHTPVFTSRMWLPLIWLFIYCIIFLLINDIPSLFKNTSTILTALLLIPIGAILLSAVYRLYVHQPVESGTFSTYMLWQSACSVLIYLLFFGVAVYLHIKTMFRENSVMCGTLISAYLLFTVSSYLLSFLFLWLK